MTPAEQSAIEQALHAGDKIEAIKLYREATGAPLAEAKDAVERRTWTSASTSSQSPSPEQLQQIDRFLFEGKKIQAIKIYRGAVGGHLVDARQWTDAREAGLRATDPAAFRMAKKSGCLPVLLAAAILPCGLLLLL